MNIIGFNLTKIAAERTKSLSSPTINTNIQFTNVEKEHLSMLPHNVVKVSFEYSVIYSSEKDPKKTNSSNTQAEIGINGFILLATEKEEYKEFEKLWKKKQVPEKFIIPLHQFILQKCSIRALPLQDEMGIPSPYLNFPTIQKKEE